MDRSLPTNHIKLCLRNLKSSRIKCCAVCPFEEEITNEFPKLKPLFIRARLRGEYRGSTVSRSTDGIKSK